MESYTYCVGTTREKKEFNNFRFCSFLRKNVLRGSDQPCQFLKSSIRLGFHSHQTMIIWHKKLGKNYSFGAFVHFVHYLWFDQLTWTFVHGTDDIHKVNDRIKPWLSQTAQLTCKCHWNSSLDSDSWTHPESSIQWDAQESSFEQNAKVMLSPQKLLFCVCGARTGMWMWLCAYWCACGALANTCECVQSSEINTGWLYLSLLILYFEAGFFTETKLH